MWSFFFLGPSLMWSLFSWGTVWCGVFFWGPVLCGVRFFGAQFDVKFVYSGPQFDVEFVFWRQFEGSLSGATGILAQGIKSRTRILCRIHSHFRLTVEHFLRACLPACVPDPLTHSLTQPCMKEARLYVAKPKWKSVASRERNLGEGLRWAKLTNTNLRIFQGQQMSDDDHDDVCCYSLQHPTHIQ